MRRLLALAAAGLLVVSLSACAARHATLEDCVNRYVELGKPQDVSVVVCGNMIAEIASGDRTQESFDELFLPK